ncbi:MAG: hypothetical protein Fur009_1650 [Candidatus Microgenomates bacterium]
MKKNNLKNKVLKKIYFWELKKTTIDLFLKVIVSLIGGLLLLIFAQIFFEILNEQKTFDLINFYGEDFEVFKRYFLDNVFVFWIEIPKYLLLLILFLILILSYIFLTFLKNWSTLENKIKSLMKFFKKI